MTSVSSSPASPPAPPPSPPSPPCTETNPDLNPETPTPSSSWSEWLPTLFTDEQRTALEDDEHPCDCKPYIYNGLSSPPDHHTQLLDALQLGTVEDTKGVFRTQLDRTHTSAGRYTLYKWLDYPLTTAEDIRTRSQTRQTLLGTDASSRAIRHSLATMESEWTSLCWCWHEGKSKTELVENLLFTGVFAPLNRIPLVQNVYHHMRVCGTPLIHCLAPIVPVVLAYLMLWWMGSGMTFSECWDMSMGVLKNTLWFDDGSGDEGHGGSQRGGGPLGLLFGGGGAKGGRGSGGGGLLGTLSTMVPALMKSLKWVWWIVFVANIVLMLYQCYRHYKLLAHVYHRTYQAATWVRHAREMTALFGGPPSSSQSSSVEEVFSTLDAWSTTAHPEFTLFTNAFDFLNAYGLLRQTNVRRECEQLVRQIGVMDALQSVDALLRSDGRYHEPESIQTPPLSTSESTSASVSAPTTTPPVLELTQAFHPKLDTATQTLHDLTLDRHTVLTGSNASGKSTVLKTLLLNVLLAQSWGVCCAASMRWTPFETFRGYLYTVDDCGRESLFQAQIRRIEEFIQDASAVADADAATTTATTTGHSLLVVDEILNSTNPIEAMLLSYQYARIIGNRLSSTCRLMMTTHYPVLTTLAKHHPTQFVNWAMGPQYAVQVGQACHASSAIGTVREMTRILTPADHTRLDKAYQRMYKRLAKMRFKELDNGDNGEEEKNEENEENEEEPVSMTQKTALEKQTTKQVLEMRTTKDVLENESESPRTEDPTEHVVSPASTATNGLQVETELQ